jgi:hypothetical protein
MKITVFWDVAPCSLKNVYRRFRGACCFHHEEFLARGLFIALMMEAESTTETSVKFYQTTWLNIPEDSDRQTENYLP